MKTKSESMGKSKDTGSTNHARESGKSCSNNAYPREQMIAVAAYFHAERRGFTPGYEVADWLQAEADMGHLF